MRLFCQSARPGWSEHIVFGIANAVFAHLAVERGGLEAKAGRRAVVAVDLAAAFFKRVEDRLLFLFAQGWSCPRNRLVPQCGRRWRA